MFTIQDKYVTDYICGEFGFAIKWKKQNDCAVSCKVYEIIGIGEGEVRLYEWRGGEETELSIVDMIGEIYNNKVKFIRIVE